MTDRVMLLMVGLSFIFVACFMALAFRFVSDRSWSWVWSEAKIMLSGFFIGGLICMVLYYFLGGPND